MIDLVGIATILAFQKNHHPHWQKRICVDDELFFRKKETVNV